MEDREGITPGQSASAQPLPPVVRRYVGASRATPPPKTPRSYKPDPAWNKLLLLIGAAVAAVALLVVPGIVNRGGENPIAAAAEATRNAPGVRMDFRMSAQGPVPITMTGTGVMNGETQRAYLQFNARAASTGAGFSMTEVVDHLDLYMRAPQLTQQLGGTKSWLLIRAGSFLGDLYSGSSGGLGAGLSASPAEQLEQLESSSDHVTVVGREVVGGVATTHYSATIDLQGALDELRDHSSGLADLVEKELDGADGNETVDVWVDAEGLVRRLTSSMAMGALGNFTMSIDFSDYGIHPKIDVPPQTEVYDATPMLEQLLNGSGDAA